MERNLKLGELSVFRTELMGMSTLLILICHMCGYVNLSTVARYILSLGNIGVDLFLFLSGMGMWNSLSNGGYKGIRYWYIHRYLKLFIPYLIIILPYDAYRYAIGQMPGFDSLDYLFGLSTLRFYVSHDTPWFIAALIPLYLLSPLFFRLLRKYRWTAAIVLICIFYLCLFIPASFQLDLLNNVIKNTQFVIVRATVFVLGFALGQPIKENKQISLWWLIVLFLVGILVVIATRHLVYGYFFLTMPLLFVFCKFIRSGGVRIRKFVHLMGEISLESYILNGILPKIVITIFAALQLLSGENMIPYIVACLISIPVGYGFHLISKMILGIITSK